MIKHRNGSLSHIFAASLLWLVVWSGTQGLFMSEKLRSLMPGDPDLQIIIATSYIFILLIAALILFKKSNAKLFIRSKQLYLYLLPVVLLVAFPFHYSLDMSLFIYIPMILITVFWQDYLTFGLFQGYLQSKISPAIAALAVGVLFALGHVLFYLESLSSSAAFSWLGFLAVSLLFAWLRFRYKTIYAIDVLHLSFLLLFV